MKFIDSTMIDVVAGHGGDGIVSFMRGKYRPKMGPDGGDGGEGGSVYLIGNNQLNTLATLQYKQLIKAGDGQRGGTNSKTGRSGEDVFVAVPCGTIAYDVESGEKIGEVLATGDRLLLAKGGARGLGNIHWLTSTNQAPDQHKLGEPGEQKMIRLELKLMADIGLAGFPNAGKSTLLSRISAARPKIADYPFTTLVPNLGVVSVAEEGFYGQGIVVADIPGLIEGASDGKGLGHAFLRHLERTAIIAYVVDLSAAYESRDALVQQFKTLQRELGKFSETLANKRSLIVLSKSDLLPQDEITIALEDLSSFGQVVTISAVSGAGLSKLTRIMYEMVQEERQREPSVAVNAAQWTTGGIAHGPAGSVTVTVIHTDGEEPHGSARVE